MRPAGWRPPARQKKPQRSKIKRGKPLPSWLAAAILFGGLLIIGIFFAIRLSRVGYEGPDIHPEFRELKKEYQRIQEEERGKVTP